MKSLFTVALLAVVHLLSAQNEVLDTRISNNQLIVTVEVEPGYTAYTPVSYTHLTLPTIYSV